MLFWGCAGILHILLERARHGCAPKIGEQGGRDVITLGCLFCTLCAESPCREHFRVHFICRSWLIFQILSSEEFWTPGNVALPQMLSCEMIDPNFRGWKCKISLKFPPFLQTRDRRSLFHLIFHSLLPPFFLHTMKPSNVSSRNHWVHCRTGKQWFLEPMLVSTAPHVDHSKLAPSFCIFLTRTVWTGQIVCPAPCSFYSCKNSWSFQLRRDQRLKSPCWFTATCGRHENSLHLYIWTLERLCLPRLGHPPALSWNLLSRGYGRLSSLQEVLEITISCMCLSA